MNNRPTCEDIRELIPAYCLGVLDDDEKQQVDMMLDDCPELQEDMNAYRVLSDEMLLAAPQAEPPPRVLDSLMKATTPPAQKRFLNFGWLRPRYAMGVLVLLLVLTNGLWLLRMNILNDEVDTLETELAAQQIAPTPASVVQSQMPVSITMNNNQIESQVNNYAASGYTNQLMTQQAQSQAILTWRPGTLANTWIGVLEVQNLPQQQTNRAYQMWLYREAESPFNVGLFDVDDAGNGIFVFDLAQPIEDFDRFTITDEPATGNFLPSGDAVLESPIQGQIILP